MSQAAPPLVLHENAITAYSDGQSQRLSSANAGGSTGSKIVLSLVVSLIIMAIVATVVIWYYRKHKRSLGQTGGGQGVSFENPTYLKDHGITMNAANDTVNFNVSSILLRPIFGTLAT